MSEKSEQSERLHGHNDIYINIYIYWLSPCAVVIIVLYYNTVVSGFEIYSRD